MESTNSYQLKQGDEDYILSITIIEPNIKIACEDSKSQIYSKELTLEDIKSLDEIFSNVQNTFDITESFDNILRNEKVRVEEESDLVQVIFFIASENKNIQILLEKEGGAGPLPQEEKLFDENQIMEQIGENINLAETNYVENIENIEYNLETNVDTNLNINTNNEFVQNETQQQTVTTEATNDLAGFNLDEFLKNTTPETTQGEYNLNVENLATNIDTNINTDINTNININTEADNKYIINTKNEFTDINTGINTDINTNIPQVSENVTNIESYDKIINTNQTTELNINIPTETKKEEISYSTPYITPVMDEQPKTQTQIQNINYSNQIINQSTTTKTETVRKVEMNLPKETKKTQYHEVSLTLPKDKKAEEEEKRILKLQGEQNILKSDISKFNSKIIELTNLINSYKSKISILQSQKNTNEIDLLRQENLRIKQQLAELNKLRNEASQAQYLRNQLSELDSLRAKAAQVDSIKAQLLEINTLKMKIAELNGIKDKLDEMNRLKQEINMINAQAKTQTQTQSQKQEVITKTTKSIIKGDIIHNLNELELITRKINHSNSKITLNLLYKATADTDSAVAFHQKCDRAESSLVLVETDKGKRFGGYTSTNWRGDCIDKKDEKAFVFSLDKMETYDIIEGEDAIGCYPKFGPIFMGCQIRIYDNAFKQGGTTYEKGTNYETEEDYELTGGDRTFGVKEIEVYEVIVE